jgi:two-component system sensor histidine kinase KdpD
MGMMQAARVRKAAGDVALGVLGVGVVTLACYPLHLQFAIPAFLYLLVVVALSPVGGFTPAAITSIFGVACLDFFFVPPLLTWNIENPLDGVALGTYLLTSLIITRLASKARMEARAAENKRRDLARLYEAAWRLLSTEPQDVSAPGVLHIFREVFKVNAVCLFDASTETLEIDGESAHGLADRTRKASLLIRDDEDQPSVTSIRCLNIAGKQMGAIGFEGLDDADSVAGPLSMLAAGTLERAQSFAAATTAAATAQAEVLRTAIVDAMAHQFNTPLAAILTAAGGMREAGPLAPQQLQMAEMIETETVRLGRLTTRLLRTARLDRDQVQPRLEPTNLAALVARTVEECRAEARTLSLQLPPAPVEVKSDRELLALALTQLVDNALKYSLPGSTVEVRLESKGEDANVRVTNSGSSIAPEEREHIFERFCRGASAHFAPGTGLGLYVARKIVLAHSGRLYLEKQGPDSRLITFCLSLPLLNETQHVLKAS